MPSAQTAIDIVRDFLAASMAPDPVKAASYMADGVVITFTGGRAMASATEITTFNASRYRWVKKLLGDFDCMEKESVVVVYATGTLYGEWPDGRSFSGNRYVDRYEVAGGKIVRMDVWNDSAEWILAPAIAKS
ncbi:nuclear transport factor 2 family protein [Pokkaliibacter sp. MBI-7]|uniref:nuclear transport factor 2 family protein n=1 Tax=Pokkaliibacter sp. MBI-7 TaxID=3040600 RepID=UPI00244C381F|nr:nuclear transport factor 2 family protein [Pokkaliibacter sp. MBI-7]MDH2436373.1 nuclear transport factor 2 family protein [Pokkaliibacter sp. MBI-7]